MNIRRPLLSRRTLLRAGAVGIALPLLDAMLPRAFGAAASAAPKRLLLVARPLGLHTPFLFPEKPGLDYEQTRYLKLLEKNRGQFTVFSGMSHKGHREHTCLVGLFTGVEWEMIKNPAVQLRNTISLDMLVAESIGNDTRFRNLVLGRSDAPTAWTAKGVAVPPEDRQTEAFKQLFIDGTPSEIAREVQRLRDGKSILDGVREQASEMGSRLGAVDRDRIDLMFTSIRDAEKQLQREQAWATKPKPKVDYPVPKRDFDRTEIAERERLWFDIARLALMTDSTRVINLGFDMGGRAKVPGFSSDHHDSSHHGKDPAKIEQLAIIEEAELSVFNEFLNSMKQVREPDGTLLDHTVVLHASNLGNASMHSGDNLPLLVAGGGLKHKGHVAFDRKDNKPLSNLYVRMLQQLGVESEKFGCSTGVLSEV